MKEKDNGTKLLLRFAIGPLIDGVCGSKSFSEKAQKYLKGDDSLELEIKIEIPNQLKTAWPFLLHIAQKNKSEALAYSTVYTYIFYMHNKMVPPACAVKSGIVKKINVGEENDIAFVETEDGLEGKVNFLNSDRNKIQKGEKIFFHHNWFVEVSVPSK
ncbi:MAG: hypothetical protein K9M15_01170 [Candidatus Marinimicrobia bacterium]|nr:hypothetical protein [Candidatus Neomarinimicrobiota bacterium]